ncbi:hypothetical protein PP175_22595 [Aneurinibacillus sp. Ricciae_BoGa-3]|uniref:hypothetical protein n=1 Tax=Aneurinibacillus sp. Ricciae_BoGa-3 TaxID=3022697 RepID=UPI00234229B8|nr:hypothetical protein [Aneurinibacillus sp. Ricciae_BoGa-3]WCK54067.1 hypothetical protein PP175_22595 [Aneurinibacillus sp. Ricciae_BoGa-3]
MSDIILLSGSPSLTSRSTAVLTYIEERTFERREFLLAPSLFETCQQRIYFTGCMITGTSRRQLTE